MKDEDDYAEWEDRLTRHIEERVIARLTERLDLALKIGRIFLRLIYLLFGALVFTAFSGKPIARFLLELLRIPTT